MKKFLILAKYAMLLPVTIVINLVLDGYDFVLDFFMGSVFGRNGSSRREKRQWKLNIKEIEVRDRLSKGKANSGANSGDNAGGYSKGKVVNHLAAMNRKLPSAEKPKTDVAP